MSKLALLLGAVLAFFATAPIASAQHAHGGHGGYGAQHGVQTAPADGAMGIAPETFSITFAHPMRLTSLVVTPRGGDPIAVALTDSAPAATISAALPRLAAGNYTIAWTAVGDDGHVMTGRVRYMVH